MTDSPDTVPYLVTLNVVDASDGWLRKMIRGDLQRAGVMSVQRVIVQGSQEASRIGAKMAQLKYARHKPWGGAMHQRIEKRWDGTWSRYALLDRLV